MMTRDEAESALSHVYSSLGDTTAGGHPVYRGKVRDVVSGDKALLLVASDRISAFDRVLSTVPFKGEVLSRISAWWFDACSDIVPNHLLPNGDPVSLGIGRVTLVRKVRILPVEVVVRGYLAGSAWRDYVAGKRVSGIELPQGLSRNERFPIPLITPSTKEENGHDRPISCAEIVSSGLVSEDIWHEVQVAALSLFRRGQELAERSGLILVDTKYEFGVVDGRLYLADELHSPDSSRYWWAENYEELFREGGDQRELDKEPFRRWLAERGFTGEESVPSIPDSVRIDTAMRYVHAYEAMLGGKFESIGTDPQSEEAFIGRIIAERLR
jgi:phosphoribosylaminoimidazole-succinocarboxamide synthase